MQPGISLLKFLGKGGSRDNIATGERVAIGPWLPHLAKPRRKLKQGRLSQFAIGGEFPAKHIE